MKSKIYSAILIFVTLLLVSCGNLFSSGADEVQDGVTTGETYIWVRVNNVPKSRTINPGNYVENEFTNFQLVGRPYGLESDMITLFTADSLSSFNQQKIIIPESGEWELAVTAEYNGVVCADLKVVNLLPDTNNTVAFALKVVEKVGGCDIKFSVPDYVRRVAVDIMDAECIKTILMEDIIPEGESGNKTARFYRYPGDKEKCLPSGTYHISFQFDGGSYTDGFTTLNRIENYIVISDAKITTAEIALDFNNVYTISYDWNGGEIAGGQDTKFYSLKSIFDLPTAKYSGSEPKNFIGWRNTATGEIITKIERGTHENLELQAVYAYNVLYVSNNVSGEAGADVIIGDEANSGFTPDSPLKSIDKACEIIAANPHPDVDWTIYVTGSVSSAGTSATGANQYKSSIIPDTITTGCAKSITITGSRDPDANGLPVDEINRNLNRSTGAGATTSTYGTALVVSTSVPVTIKNLKITHGKDSSSSSGGGALRVESGATVTLGDGVWLYDNYAVNGGAVYNLGTLYVVGSAAIGNPNASTTSTGANTVEGSSNRAQYGGGIYNVGNLYLGYSNYVSETVNTPKEWTGGVTYNSAEAGGAIFNAEGGTIVMKSGRLAFCAGTNTTGTTGGGAVANKGTFTMNDGVIEYNSTDGTTGGGFKNFQNSTFYFAGGSIKSNKTKHNYGSTYPTGGGVQNEGNMYVYGNAVIGDASATTAATDEDHCSNFAVGYGGGIFVSSTGNLYLGYKSFTSTTENVSATWNGGIYYNYTSYNCNATGGGGMKIDGTAYMNSGTIAYNGTVQKGGEFNYDGIGAAVYVDGSFYLSGSASIPAGADNKHDIYINNNYDARIIHVTGKLADTFSAVITPCYYEGSTAQKLALSIVDGADTDYDTERGKFTITPQVDTAANMTTYWMIDDSGKLARSTGTFKLDVNFEQPSFNSDSVGITVKRDSTSGTTILDSITTVSVGTTVCFFTSSSAYSSCEWTIDGKSSSEVTGATVSTYTAANGTAGSPNSVLTLNTTGWAPGYHEITIFVLQTSNGHYLSYEKLLKLTAN